MTKPAARAGASAEIRPPEPGSLSELQPPLERVGPRAYAASDPMARETPFTRFRTQDSRRSVAAACVTNGSRKPFVASLRPSPRPPLIAGASMSAEAMHPTRRLDHPCPSSICCGVRCCRARRARRKVGNSVWADARALVSDAFDTARLVSAGGLYS